MGKLLGRSEQAEQLLADYDAHVADVRAILGADQLAQLEVTAFRPYGDGSAFLIWVNSFSDTILADVGLRHPQAQWEALPDGAERINDLSLEMLPLLDADLIFTVTPWNDDTTGFFNSLTDNALWQQLRAVKAGKVYTVSGPWNEGSVIAAHLVLDELVQHLTAAGQ
jgi:iron complex transport system substrate-binding protein